MSAWWVIVVKGLTGVRGADYAVLRSLAWKARDDGMVTITAEELVTEAHVSRATLFRSLKRLERAGLIERDRAGKPTTYRLRQSQDETIQSQDETISQSQDETIPETDSLTMRLSESQDETVIVSRVRHIETETSTNTVGYVVPRPQREELEPLQIPGNNVLHRIPKDVTKELAHLPDNVKWEWQTRWDQAVEMGTVIDTETHLLRYLAWCEEKGRDSSPAGWWAWFLGDVNRMRSEQAQQEQRRRTWYYMEGS